MMPAWLLTLLKYVPGLTGILDKMTGGGSSRAEELRAEAELEEARAFRRGRYAPKYVLKYVCIAIFGLCALLIIVGMVHPGLVDLDRPLESIERLASVILSLGE